MATSKAVAKPKASQTPYQLDVEQTLKASRALLQHVRTEAKRITEASNKKNLLKAEGSEEEEDDADDGETPIWLNLTTKQHIVDQNRLKPSKISVPHSLNKSSDLRICLITADPQRAVKNTVADPLFPTELASRITRIIGLTKLKDRYKSFEQRRQLLSEHDIFLADDRIITRLPKLLGKIFYKGTAKRPIPIQITKKPQKSEKSVQSTAQKSDSAKDGPKSIASPATVAKEIEKAMDAIPVNLKPGTNVATRVGLVTFTPEQLSENISTVVEKLIEKHVVKGWRNVKAIHIKSPTSLAVPIWLADDLWAEDENVIDNTQPESVEETSVEEKKRKRNPATTNGPQAGPRKKSKVDEVNSSQQALDREKTNLRKDRLAAQKAQAYKDKSLVSV